MEGTIDQNRLIALLLEEKLINKRQIKEALTEVEKSRKPLPQVLLDLRLVTPAVLSELQAKAMGMEHVRLMDVRLEPNILQILPKRFAIEHKAIPISLNNNVLTVAMERPQDVLAIDEIKMLTGHNVRSVVCSPKDIEYGLEQYPPDEGVQLSAGQETPALRQFVQFFIFMLLLVLPLVVVTLIARSRQELINALMNFNNLVIVLGLWFIYAVILFYIYSLVLEPERPAPPKRTEPE